MSSKPCILVVDDEPEIRKMLSVTLTATQFKVVEAESGNEALRLAGSYKPDAILLDLGLPDIDGTEVIQHLREWSDTPVIVISARGDAGDIVEAFEFGANDYMTKPFDVRVLIARIKVSLRDSWQKEVGDSVIEAGEIHMNMVRHEVRIQDQVVDFSPREYELLNYLMRHKGKMLTHQQILKAVWGATHSHDKQYLRVYIMQVRQKIQACLKHNHEYITTEAGIGYRFDEPHFDQAEPDQPE